MKYYISQETASVYFVSESDNIYWTNINKDNTIDLDDGEWNLVEEDLVDEEFVDASNDRRLRDVYADVRKALG
jgi:hypothetical protein